MICLLTLVLVKNPNTPLWINYRVKMNHQLEENGITVDKDQQYLIIGINQMLIKA